jgi:hypothetical protein
MTMQPSASASCSYLPLKLGDFRALVGLQNGHRLLGGCGFACGAGPAAGSTAGL